jgi:hypothetical protein
MTKKVLSIDLDYIMGPTIEVMQQTNAGHFDNATAKWDTFFDQLPFKENQFYIDQANLIFAYNAFLSALTKNKKTPKVLFGYDHDSILYLIQDEKNIDLVNIDHHDDVMHGTFAGDTDNDVDGWKALQRELYYLKEHHWVNEGNWGAWLGIHDKLEKFTWIHNPESENLERNNFNIKLFEEKNVDYTFCTRQKYEFKDYNFDYIFVCLSPQYMPIVHWHYFTMFLMAYESISGEKPKVIQNRKFEYNFTHLNTHNEILHQRANGR